MVSSGWSAALLTTFSYEESVSSFASSVWSSRSAIIRSLSFYFCVYLLSCPGLFCFSIRLFVMSLFDSFFFFGYEGQIVINLVIFCLSVAFFFPLHLILSCSLLLLVSIG